MGKKNKKESKSGKKNKEGAKSKKEKTSINKTSVNKGKELPQIDPELLKEATKDIRDIFRFWNGDVYAGQFSLTPDGGILREGRGKYFTADGIMFSGRWECDELIEAERITYPDGSWYIGGFEKGSYTGLGRYNLPHLGILESSFVLKRPQGLVTLTDIDGNKWQGQAIQGALTLVPRNHFFDSEETIYNSMASTKKYEFRATTFKLQTYDFSIGVNNM